MATRIQVTLKNTMGVGINGTVTAAKSGYTTVVGSTTGSTATLTLPIAGPWIITAKMGTLRGGPVIKQAQQDITVTLQLVMKPSVTEPAVPFGMNPRRGNFTF